MARWVNRFLILGLTLRIVRFALNYPLWGDEAFLASNLIDRDFLGLMRPLNYTQVCPILFLWIEKAASLAFGFSEQSLRLFPTFASIGSLFLFRHVAGRIMRGPALILAVAIVAVGYVPVRHGGEIKPYSSDFLVSLTLLALAVEWLRRPDCTGFLWFLAVVGPVAVALSNPAIFVAAAVGLVLLAVAMAERRAGAIRPLAVFGVATLSTFLLLLHMVNGSQSASVMEVMSAYWVGAFPPKGFVPLAQWLTSVHTSHAFAYPAGGQGGASTLTTGCMFAALVAVWRRGSRPFLALCLVPFALGLLAATMHRYPYGGSARTMQYVAPMICLLAGLGSAALLERVPRSLATRLSLLLLVGVGVGMLGWDATHPYKSEYDVACRDFARKLWSDSAHGGEIACARTDFHVPLDPLGWRNDRSALYLCYQAIYSPRIRKHAPVDLDQIEPNHPLRCVVFQEHPADAPGVNAWLDSMRKQFTLKARTEQYANRGVVNRAGIFEDRYVIYEFLPRQAVAAAKTSRF